VRERGPQNDDTCRGGVFIESCGGERPRGGLAQVAQRSKRRETGVQDTMPQVGDQRP